MFDDLARIGASAAGDYEIERSLRFDSGDDAYLIRNTTRTQTPTIYTFSFWMKRTTLCTSGGSYMNIYSADAATWNNLDAGAYTAITDGNILRWYHANGVDADGAESNGALTDIGSWYHIVLSKPTGAAGTLYINGVAQTKQTTQTAEADPFRNAQYIGRRYNGTSEFDGYLAEMHMIEGQTKVASDFGEINEDTGQWVPKKYTGTHGSLGWYLKFADNSNNTSGTLGKDSSGNSNDWTPTNISVTADTAGNDSVEDTPTNNYPTLNSLHWCTLKGAGGTNHGPDFTQGNLRYVGPSSVTSPYKRTTGSTMIVNSGAWYYELTIENFDNGFSFGACHLALDSQGDWVDAGKFYWNPWDEQKTIAGTSTSYGTKPSNGDVLGCAVDIDNNTIEWFANNSSQGQLTSIGISGQPVVFGITIGFGQNKVTLNFGQQGFKYTPPTGFKALNTANLPDPTITKSDDNFNIVTYTGTGSDLAVTGVGFQPDLVWIKNRSNSGNWHDVYDSTRGVTKRIFPNEEDAEQTQSEGLKAFSTDGFTVGNNSDVGASSNTYVGWNWKESATVGFDIVSYTGNALVGGGGSNNQTISHSLGVVPEMIMVKALTAPYSGGGHWSVYHKGLSNPTNYFLNLNKNVGEVTTSTSMWNQTAPTSSVFSVGLEYDSNHQGTDYIGYLFASVDGFSKVGSFIGNGSTDGPMVHLGFRPAWVMLKRIDAASEWNIWDIKRNPGEQPLAREIRANLDSDETSYQHPTRSNDFLSNGFKMRTSDTDHNASGGTYVYLAFAKAPFKYANAR